MTWLLVILSLIGNVLNIKKDRRGFIFWMIANTGWVIVDFRQGLPAQAALFIIFFLLAAWGWYNWRVEKLVKINYN